LFTSQILGEFWNACTRPRKQNGFGLSAAETDRVARVIERDFEFLPDNRDVHDRWRQLLVTHSVKGVQVHDARLAASMYVHGIAQLLTINVREHVRGPRRQIDPRRRPPAEHAYRSSAPSNCTKVRESNPRPTSMRRPPGNATARPLLPRFSRAELAPDTSTVTQRFPRSALPCACRFR